MTVRRPRCGGSRQWSTVGLFESIHGREEALLIMEFPPPVGWADVATKRDLDALGDLLARDIEGAKHELRAEIAGLEVRMLTAFGAFRDEVHAERRAMSRAVILALVVALISMVVSTTGLG